MKRRASIAAVLLLYGAVVNLSVAWGCAVWIHERHAFAECWLAAGPADSSEAGLLIVVWSRFGSTRVLCAWQAPSPPYGSVSSRELMRRRDILHLRDIADRWAQKRQRPIPSWSTCHSLAQANDSDESISLPFVEDARGFPLRSLRCSFYPLYGPSYTYDAVDGIKLPDSRCVHRWLEHRLLPVRPLWAGFTINTLFYAAGLWLLFGGAFKLRRFIRVRRSLCPGCAYPMGESDDCSECGKPLPQRAVV